MAHSFFLSFSFFGLSPILHPYLFPLFPIPILLHAISLASPISQVENVKRRVQPSRTMLLFWKTRVDSTTIDNGTRVLTQVSVVIKGMECLDYHQHSYPSSRSAVLIEPATGSRIILWRCFQSVFENAKTTWSRKSLVSLLADKNSGK